MELLCESEICYRRQGWSRNRMRPAAAVTATLLPLMLMLLGTSAQASSSPRTVTSLVTTEIAGTLGDLPPGLSLSLVQVCPPNSTLDRVRTLGQFHRLPPKVRLISRELWPRGAVTRWQVGSLPPKGDIVGSMQQTVACREPLRSTAGHHDARVSVLVRVWGPLPHQVILDSVSTVRALWGSTPVGSDVEVVRLVAPNDPRPFVELSFHDQASAFAASPEHLRAGQVAELRLDLQVRSHLPRTPAQQIINTLQEIAATPSKPVYYLGPSFEGLPISGVTRSAFHTMTFLVYGSCPPGCDATLQVVTSEIGVAQLRQTAGCRRLASVRGVPTVDFGGGHGVFTGHVLVQVFAPGNGQAVLEQEQRALGALRSVGRGVSSQQPLPPPVPQLRALIDKACGAAPGQHGPQI